jgi:predicted SprT family Zn-dependent metalloprotease
MYGDHRVMAVRHCPQHYSLYSQDKTIRQMAAEIKEIAGGVMADEERRGRIRYANRKIEKDGHVVCVCGQLFLTEDGYADHVASCEHAERGVAAQGKVGLERDA